MYYENQYTINNTITFFYLTMCYFSYKYRDNIKAVDNKIMKNIVFIHNMNSIIMNSYIYIYVIYEVINNNIHLYGNDPRIAYEGLNHISYIFYISKYIDMIDTVIIILNKNFHQLSFLHVFHHSTMPTLILYIHKNVPYCGDMWYVVMYNSLIHIILYYYYLVTSIYGKKAISWGKYLTTMQLIQFVCCFTQQLASIMTNDFYPNYVRELNLFYSSSMFCLFMNFYFKRYKTIKESS